MINRSCLVEGCGRPHKGKDLCGMHLQRLKNTGTVGEATSRAAVVTHLLSNLDIAERRADCSLCGPRAVIKPSRGKWYCSGKLRGTLCNKCNLGLGMFKDNPKLLDAAAAYLRSYGK